jgi:membrane protein CcdC involved in cytochrome C biogenesis
VQLALTATSLVGAAAVLGWRMRETRRPVTTAKLIVPPLGMSSGFAMFLFPPTRIPWTWGLLALLAGACLLSYPLSRTSELTREGAHIMLKRSKAFLFVMLALVTLRIVGRAYVEQHVSPLQTGSIFFLLAFGTLLPWRVALYRRYRQMLAESG